MRNIVIEGTILTGPAAGEITFIPRIPMNPTDLFFQFKRLQMPIINDIIIRREHTIVTF